MCNDHPSDSPLSYQYDCVLYSNDKNFLSFLCLCIRSQPDAFIVNLYSCITNQYSCIKNQYFCIANQYLSMFNADQQIVIKFVPYACTLVSCHLCIWPECICFRCAKGFMGKQCMLRDSTVAVGRLKRT